MQTRRSRSGCGSEKIPFHHRPFRMLPALPEECSPGPRPEELHRAFGEMQKRVTQVLHGIDTSDTRDIETMESLTVGLHSLRDVAAAIVESDPHFACLHKVFEDVWLVGFTRPLKLCGKLEGGAKWNMQAWRSGFILDWQGFLLTLRDSVMVDSTPASTWRLFPSMRRCVREGISKELFQLPINYLLRDIALCLARSYSHQQPQLEKTWMKRAMQVNVKLAGLPYKEAVEQLLAREEHLPPPSPLKILGRREEFVFAGEGEQARQSQTSEKKKGYGGYGAVVASQHDLQVMRLFRQRNAFIQGLLQAAEEQGQLNETSASEDGT